MYALYCDMLDFILILIQDMFSFLSLRLKICAVLVIVNYSDEKLGNIGFKTKKNQSV